MLGAQKKDLWLMSCQWSSGRIEDTGRDLAASLSLYNQRDKRVKADTMFRVQLKPSRGRKGATGMLAFGE